MERTIQVLDAAILVVSGADGVQGHTRTVWRLLKRHHIPVFLFVNKMDQSGCDAAALMKDLKAGLDENCVDFGGWSGEKENGILKKRIQIPFIRSWQSVTRQ